MTDKDNFIKNGRDVITKELSAITALGDRIDANFAAACKMILKCPGRIIVTGMGKNSHIARKIAATLTSTGTPAFFMHPAEASHGDIGAVIKSDVVLALSNSGNTPEIVAILPVIKHLEIPLITLTGNPNSTMAKAANINIDVSVASEACPMGLAPTSSTTAALVMGDAIAVALLKARGFTAQDFALSHPGGALGKKLLLKIEDLMHKGESVPRVAEDTTLEAAILEMSQKKMGMTSVLDKNNKLLGVFTDGDLRRALEKRVAFHDTKVLDVMTKNCKTIPPKTLAIEALRLMEQHMITSLLVTDDEKNIFGIIHLHDILRAGLK